MVRTIALVGCGAVSRTYYVPACRSIPECGIEWFIDRDRERAKELAREYGSGQAACDFREVINSVEAAIVALPNHLHAEVTLAFLRQGRDVLCEKPIATSSSDGVKMVEASNTSGARLAVNLIRRRYNNYKIARRLLQAGTIGKVKQVICQEGSIFDWPLSSMDLLDRQRAGGGVLMDTGTHDLDILRWIFSADLKLVSYEDDSLGGVEANCDVELNVKSEQGDIPCRLVLGRSRKLPNKIIISGERGSIEIRQADLNRAYLRTDDGVYRIEPSDEKSRFLKGKDYFAEQMSKFLERTSSDYVQGTDAVKVLSFIESCYRNKRQMTYPWETSQSKPTKNQRLPSDIKTVLVVGASGFLGTRLVETLSVNMGVRVRAAVHHPASAARLARLPIQFVECDVLDPQQVDKAVEECDVVINCASGSYEVAVRGTSNLLEAAARHGVKKYVHLSSAAVHGFSHKEPVIDEQCQFLSRGGSYERGKIASEKLIGRYAKMVPSVILRPTLIYGPYSLSWTAGIIERIENHRTTIVGRKGLANLIYVDDVVHAIVCAVTRNDADGQALIINNDRERVLWEDYVRGYAESTGTPPVKSQEFNPDIDRVKAVFSMLRDSAITAVGLTKSPQLLALLAQIPLIVKVGSMFIKGERRKNIESSLISELTIPRADPKILFKYEKATKELYRLLTCQTIFSSTKSKMLLGFEPSISIEEGMAKSVEWAKWAGYYGWQNS